MLKPMIGTVLTLCCAGALFSEQAFSDEFPLLGRSGEASGYGARAEVPAHFVGAWQVPIDGRAHKLKTSYNIEIRITDGRSGSPEALVSYFAGNEKRPSTICRTQLTVVSSEPPNLVFEESLNYKAGKDACPIWNQVAIAAKGDNLSVTWRDARKRKTSVKMEGEAHRSTGGRECRLVGGDQGGGQVFCRTPDGDWLPQVL